MYIACPTTNPDVAAQFHRRRDLDLPQLLAPAERLLPDALQRAPARKCDARQRGAPTEAGFANLLDRRRDLDLSEFLALTERRSPDALQRAPSRKCDARQRGVPTEAGFANLLDRRRDHTTYHGEKLLRGSKRYGLALL